MKNIRKRQFYIFIVQISSALIILGGYKKLGQKTQSAIEESNTLVDWSNRPRPSDLCPMFLYCKLR